MSEAKRPVIIQAFGGKGSLKEAKRVAAQGGDRFVLPHFLVPRESLDRFRDNYEIYMSHDFYVLEFQIIEVG